MCLPIKHDSEFWPSCVNFFKRVVASACGEKPTADYHGCSADVCQQTTLAGFRHFSMTVFANYKEGYILRGFDQDRVQGQNVS